MNNQEVLQKILSHETNEEPVGIGIPLAKIFILISHLQVAQRFVNGGSAAIAKEMIDSFIEIICTHVPEAREMLEQGNDPAYDVTTEYFDDEFWNVG